MPLGAGGVGGVWIARTTRRKRAAVASRAIFQYSRSPSCILSSRNDAVEKQYLSECVQCGRSMISNDPTRTFCTLRCAERATRTYDLSRSPRPLVACSVCGLVFHQQSLIGRPRTSCPQHYGGYRTCTKCGKRCRPRPGRTLCRDCKREIYSAAPL